MNVNVYWQAADGNTHVAIAKDVESLEEGRKLVEQQAEFRLQPAKRILATVNTTVEDTTMEEVITISKEEYDSLMEDRHWLNCLEDAGVDNWSGYEYAQELLGENDD